MAGPEGKNALVVQALRYLGQDNVGPREIETLRVALISSRKTQAYERCPVRCRLDLQNGKKAGGGVGLNRIAQMAAGERADVFSETADRKGLAGAIVEKDFWVCWILKQLFSIETIFGSIALQRRDLIVEDIPRHQSVFGGH